GVHGRREERVQRGVEHGLYGDPRAALLAPAAAGGREREEDLAAPVGRGRAGAGEAEARAAGDALELVRPEGRVERDDDDAAPGRARRALGDGSVEELPDGHPVDAKLLGEPEVGENEDADGAVEVGDEATGGAYPSLAAEADHPGPGADRAL